MADFKPAFERMIKNEGGYVLVNVPGDRGGQTFAGIARNFHPNWAGWRFIDNDDMQNVALTELVRHFYEENYWNPIKGPEIMKQPVAETVFDFAVNAGVRTAAKLAQLVVESTPDGIIGPVTLGKLNQMDEQLFVLKYAIAKLARYVEICQRDPEQRKFLLGWVGRAIGDLT